MDLTPQKEEEDQQIAFEMGPREDDVVAVAEDADGDDVGHPQADCEGKDSEF